MSVPDILQFISTQDLHQTNSSSKEMGPTAQNIPRSSDLLNNKNSSVLVPGHLSQTVTGGTSAANSQAALKAQPHEASLSHNSNSNLNLVNASLEDTATLLASQNQQSHAYLSVPGQGTQLSSASPHYFTQMPLQLQSSISLKKQEIEHKIQALVSQHVIQAKWLSSLSKMKHKNLRMLSETKGLKQECEALKERLVGHIDPIGNYIVSVNEVQYSGLKLHKDPYSEESIGFFKKMQY
jgi:hypothetical protein